MPLMQDPLPFKKGKTHLFPLSILTNFSTCQTRHLLGAAAALPTAVNQQCHGQLSSTEAQQREAAGARARRLSYLQANTSC